ncbi:ATP synthase F0 subunit B [Bdellovibrionota bacterium FG-2]
METLISPAINFSILLGVLVYYLRQPLVDFVFNRHNSIRKELLEVRENLLEAQAKYEEFSSKLKSIESQAAVLRQQVHQDAQSARLRILSDAQRAASGVSADARVAAAGLYQELKGALYFELTQCVFTRVEGIIKERLTQEDRTRMREDFSKQVEAAQ